MSTVSGRSMQVPAAGGAFQLVNKEFPDPGPGQVRIRVQACGVCHSDSLTKEGMWPGLQFPRVPGHEVAGILDAVGPEVPVFKVGERVGLGWHGGHCNYCTPCRRGDFMLCENQPISGIHYDGGYADYVIAPANALALIPDDLKDAEAGPLLCAGVTTFNALRNSGARIGDTVAILGIGGLGHLAIQYAAKAGYRTIAIARGQDKGPLAKQLGAHIYIDSTTQDPAKELQKIGGAKSSSPPSPAPRLSSGSSTGSPPQASSSWSERPTAPSSSTHSRCSLAAAPSPAGPPVLAWTPKTR